jgi:multidrug efflux pump subunit AcrB
MILLIVINVLKVADVLKQLYFLIRKLKDVKQITVYGGSPIVYEIVYDYELMEKYGVALYNIISTVKNLNLRTYIGNSKDNNSKQKQKSIIIENRVDGNMDIEDLIIFKSRNKLVKIKDIAKVYKKIAIPTSYYRKMKQPVNIGIVPQKMLT